MAYAPELRCFLVLELLHCQDGWRIAHRYWRLVPQNKQIRTPSLRSKFQRCLGGMDACHCRIPHLNTIHVSLELQDNYLLGIRDELDAEAIHGEELKTLFLKPYCGSQVSNQSGVCENSL